MQQSWSITLRQYLLNIALCCTAVFGSRPNDFRTLASILKSKGTKHWAGIEDSWPSSKSVESAASSTPSLPLVFSLLTRKRASMS